MMTNFHTAKSVRKKQKRSHKDVEQSQADLIRDIFGNPFRPVVFLEEWLSDNAVSLAQAICQEQAFANMPILADALEEAGCDNAEVLDHWRNEQLYAKGCWVVDGILRK